MIVQKMNYDNITEYCYQYNNYDYNKTQGNININSLPLNSTYTYFDYMDNDITFDGSCETSWLA